MSRQIDPLTGIVKGGPGSGPHGHGGGKSRTAIFDYKERGKMRAWSKAQQRAGNSVRNHGQGSDTYLMTSVPKGGDHNALAQRAGFK